MEAYSPKASPNVGGGGPAAEGNLKLSIALGQKPTIIQKGPFYLMKQEALPSSETTGAANLMASRGLEHSYVKLTTKKMKDSLSSFLPNLPGVIDTPGSHDNSSLRGLIEKPPVCGKELHPLNALQLAGFRLHQGPLPEQYRYSMQVQIKRRRKHKKNRHKGSETPATDEMGSGGMTGNSGGGGSGGGGNRPDSDEREKRKEKKHKKHEKDAEERKKKKKEKKKKRNKEDKDS